MEGGFRVLEYEHTATGVSQLDEPGARQAELSEASAAAGVESAPIHALGHGDLEDLLRQAGDAEGLDPAVARYIVRLAERLDFKTLERVLATGR